MARVCNIVLVCEGWRDSKFARGFLKRAGNFDVHDSRNPGGSGHSWVRTQLANEVAALARFAEGRGVLALLDEDGQGVSNREREVAELLMERGLAQIDPAQGRCLLLPARNLETWLYWLNANKTGLAVGVTEEADYKAQQPAGMTRITGSDCGPAGEHLHSLNHTTLPAGCPPQLGRALAQLREFLNAVRR